MSSPYTIDEMQKMADALHEDGFTSEQLVQMRSKGRLRMYKAYLEGRAELTMRSILRRLYEDETTVIASMLGVETVAGAKNLFTGYLSSDFKNWGTDLPDKPTADQPVEIYEMVEDGDFKTIFGSLERPIGSMLLTQSQIIAFCRDHSDKLRKEGFATFFPFKVGEEILPDLSNVFVADVYVYGRGLHAGVYRFSDGGVWHGGYRHRVVLPQQEL